MSYFSALFKNEKNILIAVIVFWALLNVGVWFWGVYGVLAGIRTAYANIRNAESEIRQLDAKRARFLDISKTLAEDSSVLGIIEKTTLDLKNPLPFIELLESLSKERNVNARLHVENLENTDNESLQHFELTASGAFVDVVNYLQILELVPYQISITDGALNFNEVTTPTTKKKSSAPKKYTTRLSARFVVRVK